MAGALTLADFRAKLIRLACRRCDCRGQYRWTTLIALFGEKAALPDVLAQLASIARSEARPATSPVAPTSRT
jgi:hypothetical protein